MIVFFAHNATVESLLVKEFWSNLRRWKMEYLNTANLSIEPADALFGRNIATPCMYTVSQKN